VVNVLKTNSIKNATVRLDSDFKAAYVV